MRRATAPVASLGVLGLALLTPLAGAQTEPVNPSASEGELPEDEPPPPPPPPAPAPSASGHVRVNVVARDGMLRLPGGRFAMGSADPKSPPNERPIHYETVAPFWIDRTEVTVEAYRACVDRRACEAPARSSASCTYDLGDPLLPISCVRWKDADAFCRAASKRLPREVEWEYAARGGYKARFPWGGSASSCAMATTLLHDATGRTCSGKRPSKVGSHPAGASPFGVMDLTGNVEEWTSDWYAENVAGGAAPAAGASHVLRGGGWLSAPSMSRTTSRDWGSDLEAGPNVGFRCARDDGP